jgi:hypothetical protein
MNFLDNTAIRRRYALRDIRNDRPRWRPVREVPWLVSRPVAPVSLTVPADPLSCPGDWLVAVRSATPLLGPLRKPADFSPGCTSWVLLGVGRRRLRTGRQRRYPRSAPSATGFPGPVADSWPTLARGYPSLPRSPSDCQAPSPLSRTASQRSRRLGQRLRTASQRYGTPPPPSRTDSQRTGRNANGAGCKSLYLLTM